MTTPTFDHGLLPARQVVFDAPARATTYPRTLSGRSKQNDFTAGGLLVASLSDIVIGRDEQHLYWNRLARWLDGGINPIIMPIINIGAPEVLPVMTTHSDGTPFSDLGEYSQTGYSSGIPHSDTALFSDTGGYQQIAFESTALFGTHSLNAGRLQFMVKGGYEFQGGEWFSINHGTKGWRAYRIWNVAASYAAAGGRVWTCDIVPPLREQTLGGVALEFINPRFMARLAPGRTMPWTLRGNWVAPHSVEFVEYFALPS